MLLRFVEKIEVTENKNIKIYYKFDRLRVIIPLNHFLKLILKHTPHGLGGNRRQNRCSSVCLKTIISLPYFLYGIL